MTTKRLKRLVAFICALTCVFTSFAGASNIYETDPNYLGRDDPTAILEDATEPDPGPTPRSQSELFSMKVTNVKDLLTSNVGGKSFTLSDFGDKPNLKITGTLTNSNGYDLVRVGACSYSPIGDYYDAVVATDSWPSGEYYSVSFKKTLNFLRGGVYYGFVKNTAGSASTVSGTLYFYAST